jgi:uncharacterized circularly permuted ATP-grasp superfamily protein
LFKLGVTFNVYSDNQGTERIFPFDVIPRQCARHEWNGLKGGPQTADLRDQLH